MDSDNSGSEVRYPPWAQVLKVKISNNADHFDWMIGALTEYDPLRMKQIKNECTPFEIVQSYAMKAYSNSAEVKK